MNQPAAIWSLKRVVFDKEINLTQNVILTQASSALVATVNRIDQLYRFIIGGPLTNVAIDTGIAPILSDLCSQAGIAATILFNKGPKGRLESEVAYNLRLERKEYVEKFCTQQNFIPETLTNREVRNSLTHIDERLADILTKDSNVGWFIDTAINKRDEFVAPIGISIKFCRCYIISENKVLHLDQELDIAKLRHECIVILAIIFGMEIKQL